MRKSRSYVFSVYIALTVIWMSGISTSVTAQNECNVTGAPIVTTGSISAADPNQVGRLFRTITNTTTCQLRRTATTSGTAALDFDQYTFTNDTGGPICVFVDLNATGCGIANNQISMAAYSPSYDPASILTNLIAEPGGSTGQNFATSMSFAVPTGGTYVIVVHNINAGLACPSYTFTRTITTNCRKAGFDHNNDGSADLAIWRPSPSDSLWSSFSLATQGGISASLGSTGDIPVAADYDGDEITEPAVFRGTLGTWYLSTDPSTNYGARRWGLAGDIPVNGDYDRDGLIDLAVFRPSTNTWYVLRSATSSYHEFVFGASGDIPVIEDYDGDGKTDPALFRPSNGLWTILQSSGDYRSIYIQMFWGLGTDEPVPADYDGDGKADVAVFRPSDGNWYIFRSSVATSQLFVANFGQNGDIPQPADYDGDLRSDPAVFRPSTATWWLQRSTSGVAAVEFGANGDIPASRPFWVQ
jgi:hypothetical protein